MKHLFLRRLFPTFLVVAMLASAAHTPTTAPTVNVSCDPCQVGQDVEITGSGYKAGSHVEIDIQGPASYSINTPVDSKGNISVGYGPVWNFSAGTYSVTASSFLGQRLVPQANTSFSVE